MLESLGHTSFIRRTVSTLATLLGYLERTRGSGMYGHYEVLQLACHGERGQLWLSDREPVELPELAEALGEITTQRPVQAVYFGSCLTMGVADGVLEDFRKVSGVRYVLGYTKAVVWIESAAFELMVLSALPWYSRVGDAINYLQRGVVGGIADALGFSRFPR